MRKSLVAVVLSVLLYSACSKPEPICYEPLTVTSRVKYVQRSLRIVDTIIESVLLDTFYIYLNDTILPYINARNIDADSVGVAAIPNTGYISFYLNPNTHRTRYALRYDTMGTYHDTIEFYHNSYPVFISNDCGYTHYFKIDSIRYTSPFVDSMFITNYEVTLDNAGNNQTALLYFFKML